MKIQQLAGAGSQSLQARPSSGFGAELAQAQDRQLRFSAHAQNRLQDRGIKLSSKQLGALNDAVEQVRAKGARETLMLVDQLALVVSVTNRTVITAAGQKDLKEQIFTNIDSAVIIGGVDRKEP